MINEREKKFLRLALDPAAKKGEIDNAAVALVNSLRSRGVMPEQFFVNGASVSNSKFRFIFPWGQHSGKHFDEIDPGYLRWVNRVWYPKLDDEGKDKYSTLYKEIKEYLA
jgi:hypothetical protein